MGQRMPDARPRRPSAASFLGRYSTIGSVGVSFGQGVCNSELGHALIEEGGCGVFEDRGHIGEEARALFAVDYAMVE
jgi:hypothetical protein